MIVKPNNPAPKPMPERKPVEELRKSFPSLCFETESNIFPNHQWSIGGPCKRCGAKIDHRQFENAPVPPLVVHNEEPDL